MVERKADELCVFMFPWASTDDTEIVQDSLCGRHLIQEVLRTGFTGSG